MTERFSGRITLDEGDEVDVDLELSDAEVRLATESAEIGVWPRPDCTFLDRGDGAYQLVVDDDVVTFVPAERESFGRALEHSANGNHPLDSESDEHASEWGASDASPAVEDRVDDGSTEDLGLDQEDKGGAEVTDDSSTLNSSSADRFDGSDDDANADLPMDDDRFFVSVGPPSGIEDRETDEESDEAQSPSGGSVPMVDMQDEDASINEIPVLTDLVEEASSEEAAATGELSPFFVGTEDREKRDTFTAVPAAVEPKGEFDQPQTPAADDGVDYEELAAWFEELAEEQAEELAEQQAEESEGTIDSDSSEADESPEGADESSAGRRGFGAFRNRLGRADRVRDAGAHVEKAPPGADGVETEEANPSRGWYVDPETVAAVSALKRGETLTPAEQAIAEARGDAPSVISTEEVIESQRSLRESNVVRRLTWDLVRKVGAGVLLGLGMAALVFLFPNAWEVLTRDSRATVVTEDPATSTTVDPGDTTVTTVGAGPTTTVPDSTTTTTTTTPPAIDSVFDLSSEDFFERWNRAAIPIGEVLAFGVYPPPGAFENEFYPYLSMTGGVGEDGRLEQFGIVVDPTGPSDSDRLAIQALGVAIAVAEPDLTGGERADLLATLGLDVRQPQLGGINGDLIRGPYRYRLVFDSETTLLTFTISQPGAPLPGSEGEGPPGSEGEG